MKLCQNNLMMSKYLGSSPVSNRYKTLFGNFNLEKCQMILAVGLLSQEATITTVLKTFVMKAFLTKLNCVYFFVN